MARNISLAQRSRVVTREESIRSFKPKLHRYAAIRLNLSVRPRNQNIAKGKVMKMRLVALGSMLLASCASAGWPTAVDPATVIDTPDRFLVLEVATGATSEPSGPACSNPLVDPRNQTRLTLIRSTAGHGDYQPDKLSYGLSGGQLLRIDCNTGRPLGATSGAP